MKTISIILVLIAIATGSYYYWAHRGTSYAEINSFEECSTQGNPIIESYPRQCRTKDGRTFKEGIGNELEKINLIRVATPRPNQTIPKPVIIKGEARGTWFFEASFPIKIIDKNGNQLGTGVAQAQGEWMTEDFVPFETVIQFTAPTTDTGSLILEKDNPSGLPQYDDQLVIPIKFK